MVFRRKKKIGKHFYWYLVSSRRDGSKVRQTHIKYLGRVNKKSKSKKAFMAEIKSTPGDFDKDGVSNKLDCAPLNSRLQDGGLPKKLFRFVKSKNFSESVAIRDGASPKDIRRIKKLRKAEKKITKLESKISGLEKKETANEFKFVSVDPSKLQERSSLLEKKEKVEKKRRRLEIGKKEAKKLEKEELKEVERKSEQDPEATAAEEDRV